NAKLLREAGKILEAEAILREAALVDPTNPEIFYYLDLIQQDRHQIGARVREYDSRRSLVDVEKAWAQPIDRESLPQPNPYATRDPQVHTSAGRHRIMEKLNKITINEVIYEGLPLSEVVKNLADESR